MVLPIYTYGWKVLREPAREVKENTPEIQQLIDDMIETMGGASGAGLAAPQVGQSLRLFVMDVSSSVDPDSEEDSNQPTGPIVMINPQIVEESEETCDFEEGCLSIPDIRERVTRPEWIKVEYLDRDFEPQVMEIDGMAARVIQHEYDHLEGILFLDRISALRRHLLKRRLRDMAAGRVEAEYPLSIPLAAERAR